MVTARKLSYEELETKLLEAEDIIGALRHHEVDAIVGEDQIAVVRLREVEEALERVREELEARVVERTADLARANHRLEEIIAEQEHTRRQLEQYAGQLRDQAELLDLAHDMIFVHDMDGKIVFWNRGAENAYGWKREDALGQLSHKLLQTRYAEPLMRITAEIIRTGWWEGEVVHTAWDGRKLTVASRWVLRRDRTGRPTAILEIDNDITRRKEAEREMAETRRFAESIVETIQECLVVLDPELRVLSANRSFHETFGTTPKQVEGRLFHTLHGDTWDIPDLRGRLRNVLRQGTSFQGFEVECRSAAGPVSLLLSAQPLHRDAAGAEMILLVIQDISVRKKQEQEIEVDRRQLASLTEELMLLEERQRRQIATTLHDSIGQSLVFAKRELSLLQQKVPPEMQAQLRQANDQIADAIQRARDLTFELSPSTLYSFGLQAAVEELAEQFAESEGFTCRVNGLDGPVPLAEQVRTMLYRSVRELLVNVVKHAGADSVVITMTRDERNVMITVRDDGKGFDPSVLDVHPREHGFGLFSVRERLTHIGGKFVIESAEGKGTAVTLMAPLDLGQQVGQEF